MLKGKILKFDGNEVVVLSDSLKYEKIKLKPQMALGQVIYYFEEDIITPQVQTETSRLGQWLKAFDWFKVFGTAVPAFILLFVVMMLNQGPAPVVQPYGLVSIDINPSISLHVDKHGIVIRSLGNNQDGESLLVHTDITNQPLNEAIEEILEAAVTDGYLTEDKQVIIASAENSDTQTLVALIDNSLEAASVDDPYTVYIAEVDYSMVKGASEQEISLGRYFMESHALIAEDEPITSDTIESLSIDSDTKFFKARPATPVDIETNKEEKEAEHLEKKDALEQEKLEREAERLEKKDALEQEKLEREAERLEKKDALEQEKLEREAERLEKKDALEQQKLDKETEQQEKKDALEQQKLDKEAEQQEKKDALEQQKLDKEAEQQEKKAEQEERKELLEEEKNQQKEEQLSPSNEQSNKGASEKKSTSSKENSKDKKN